MNRIAFTLDGNGHPVRICTAEEIGHAPVARAPPEGSPPDASGRRLAAPPDARAAGFRTEKQAHFAPRAAAYARPGPSSLPPIRWPAWCAVSAVFRESRSVSPNSSRRLSW